MEGGEAAAASGKKGCIRTTRGPWTVRRRRRGGAVTTSLRHPTPRERENNRQRERRRRQVATRIFAGLRAHGGYTLPKHADQNDVLLALCAEAGYLVDDEGNVTGRGEHSGGADHLPPSSYGGAAVAVPLQPPEPEQKISLELSLSFAYM